MNHDDSDVVRVRKATVGTKRTSSRRLRIVIEVGVEKDAVLFESPILELILEKKIRARMAFVVFLVL